MKEEAKNPRRQEAKIRIAGNRARLCVLFACALLLTVALVGVGFAAGKLPSAWRVDSVRYHEDGRIAEIYGDLTPAGDFRSQAEVAWTFLEGNKAAFGLTKPKEELRMEFAIGEFVLFCQYSRGIPFADADAFFLTVNGSRIAAVSTNFHTGLNLDTTPGIDSTAAKQVAARFDKWDANPAQHGHSELVIFPDRDACRLAWQVETKTPCVQYYVNAWSGELLASRQCGHHSL